MSSDDELNRQRTRGISNLTYFLCDLNPSELKQIQFYIIWLEQSTDQF